MRWRRQAQGQRTVNMPIAVTTERFSWFMTVWYALRA